MNIFNLMEKIDAIGREDYFVNLEQKRHRDTRRLFVFVILALITFIVLAWIYSTYAPIPTNPSKLDDVLVPTILALAMFGSITFLIIRQSHLNNRCETDRNLFMTKRLAEENISTEKYQEVLELARNMQLLNNLAT